MRGAAAAAADAADAADPKAPRIVITGASSGIGAALAREFAARFPRSRLLLIARNRERLETLVASMAPGVQATLGVLDVTDRDALRSTCRDWLQTCGGVDIVIANAGVSEGTLHARREDHDAFARIMATNWQALVDTFEPFIDTMRTRRHGTLVGIASVAGLRGMPGSSAYCASKAAAISTLESMRVELAPDGLRVVTILPGFVRTPMTDANPFPMPFMIEADRFARSAVDAILAGRRRSVIPFAFACVAPLIRMMPIALFDLIAGRFERKPPRAA